MIGTALQIAEAAAPTVARWLGGASAEAVAERVVAAARRVTGEPDPDGAVDLLSKDPKLLMEFQREMLALDRALAEQETARLREVNQTIRLEYLVGDKYTRRWRPTFGYVVAITWGMQAAAVVFAFVYAVLSPASAGPVAEAITKMLGALSTHWPVALAVLGLYVKSRQGEKETAFGAPPELGLLDALAERIAGRPRREPPPTPRPVADKSSIAPNAKRL